MKVTIECPHGRYVAGMRIWCDKIDGLCPFQRYKDCKGWWILTDNAGNARSERSNKNGIRTLGG